MKKVLAAGPPNADILIVGEAPGVSEEVRGKPFVGSSGIELDRMLAEVGINRNECFVTNVCKYRPPGNQIDAFFTTKTQARKEGLAEICGRYPRAPIVEGLEELYREIDRVRPRLIITLGDTALWAITGQSGITKWRGSVTRFDGIPVLSTYHPAAVLRMWAWRFITVRDLSRARTILEDGFNPPDYNFTIRPDYPTVISRLDSLLKRAMGGEKVRLGTDIETRQQHIACLGIAWTTTDALCVPFMDMLDPRGYWPVEEETQIVWKLRQLLTHPNVQVVGQNWNYDMQYIARYWGFLPWPYLDTMIAHHALFPGLPKGLDFISSLYNDFHVYWKDEGKTWNPKTCNEEQLWIYNCKDCTNTLEASYHIEEQTDKMKMHGPSAFQHQMIRPVVRSMLRGVLTSSERRMELYKMLTEAMIDRQNFINHIVGREFNPRSAPQMKKLFYNELKVPPILHKKTRKPTLDKNAMGDLRKKADPIIYPLIDAIVEFRRAGTALSVATTKIDHDHRIRCSYNIAGTETFRLASSEDAFGFGTNLQNISKGD